MGVTRMLHGCFNGDMQECHIRRDMAKVTSKELQVRSEKSRVISQELHHKSVMSRVIVKSYNTRVSYQEKIVASSYIQTS